MHLKAMIIALSALGLAAMLGVPSKAATIVDADEMATVGGIDDLPVMPGFLEDIDNRVVFDKPEGRIIVSILRSTSACTDQDVSDYYGQVLAAREWLMLPSKRGDESAYMRDHERLDIQSECGGATSVIRFLLYPLELFSSSTSQ